MNLKSVPKPLPENMDIIKGELNINAFRELCEELAFASILKDLDGFAKPFK
jgi:hypothetical protein